MTTGSIYLLTFPNGKVYVGQTVLSPKRRFAAHRFAASLIHPRCPVHCAWKKYGEPTLELLTECNIEILSDMEKDFIALFASFGPHGYNMTPGGEVSPMLTPETVEKVRLLALTPERIARNREVHLGSKRTDECRAAMSAKRKGQNKGVPKSAEHRAKIAAANRGIIRNVGRKNTEETRAKMSEAARRRWANLDFNEERRARFSAGQKKRYAK